MKIPQVETMQNKIEPSQGVCISRNVCEFFVYCLVLHASVVTTVDKCRGLSLYVYGKL